ncbi:MAG TPA: CARDB domain-containing protein, partial [Myxococcaceae bacterium]
SGSVPELIEDNNATAGNQVGVGYAPDFVISSISTGPTANIGGQLLATITVCNQGTQAGSAPLDVFFSTDTFISINDYISSGMPVPYLEAGACATITENVWAPYQSGTYYAGAIIDRWGGIPELFKDNNAAASGTVVVVGP